MNLNCSYCPATLKDFDKYNSHIIKHKNLNHFKYGCPICLINYTNFKSYRSHVSRSHNFLKEEIDLDENFFYCLSCPVKSKNITDYKTHLIEHLTNNIHITCNINNCQSLYSKKSSYNSHFYRYHARPINDTTIVPTENNLNEENDNNYLNPENSFSHTVESSDDIDSSLSELIDHNADFRTQITSFILKMESKLLIPKSAIDVILSNILDLIDTNNKHQLAQFLTQIYQLEPKISLPIPDVEDIMSNNLFNEFLGEHGDLSTQYLRKKFFTNNTNFVAPIKLLLGRDDKHNQCFAYYVPIKDSIKALLNSNNLLEKALIIPDASNSNSLNDLEDGYIVKRITSNIHPLPALNIILYQDAFEICNPLGSSKTKHKVIGMYYRLNILSRSNIDNIQLVMLTYDKYLKMFTQEQIFGMLVNDLMDLEKNGILFENTIKIIPFVSCMAGDNLGSHYIAGMTENFSSAKFFCRYCEINRDTFEDNPLAKGNKRTIDEYERNISSFQEHQDLNKSKGVKKNSVFNQLEHFHTIWGLPPCLAHDICEGIGAFDIPFILNYFISLELFTENYLNKQLADLFKLLPSTSFSSYKFKSKKLSGNGTQNMYFILLLPLAIFEKMTKHFYGDYWQMMVTLNKIIQLVLSNKISQDETAYLQFLIETYLTLRKKLFLQNLRPKHHYLLHYDELIRAYGPLINVWTFRFEQKHKYFKNIVRHSPNFINVLFTLSEKHQLFQSYLTLAPKNIGIVTSSSEKLNKNFLSTQMHSLISKNKFLKDKFNELNVSTYISLNGYVYKKGQSVCVNINTNDELVTIKIQHILFENNSINPILVGFKEIYKFLPHLNFYIFDSCSDNFKYVCTTGLKTEKCIIKYKNQVTDKLYAIIQHF